jgi:hypothetical protein
MVESASISISRLITPKRLNDKEAGGIYEVTFTTSVVKASDDDASAMCSKCLMDVHSGECVLRYAAHCE